MDLHGWGATRWGDTLDVLYWLYDRTGSTALLNLVTTIHNNSANWVAGLPTLHNVNVAQGFREPAEYSVYSGVAADLTASYNNYNTIMGSYGQFPGGGFAGDEIARPGYTDARQGFETCEIVELWPARRSCTGRPATGLGRPGRAAGLQQPAGRA